MEFDNGFVYHSTENYHLLSPTLAGAASPQRPLAEPPPTLPGADMLRPLLAPGSSSVIHRRLLWLRRLDSVLTHDRTLEK